MANSPESVLKPRVTARDFFLWLGAMAGLYVSAITLVLLFHQYANVWFPDLSLEPYGSAETGAIRIAIAFLLVFFPLYVWLTRLLHNDLRAHPEKRELWVRKWLIYLALFVAGIAMAIDLVMTLNTFLNGELTLRFAMKALVILGVIGFGFWYYLEELKGTWEEKEPLSKMIASFATLVIAASIGGAFFIIGSPAAERFYRIDDQKVNDLAMIQSQVGSYWQLKEKLPAELSDMNDPLSGYTVPNDPDSGAPYEYRATEKLSFELCATFNRPNRPAISGDSARPVMPYGTEYWQHGAGRTCFTRTVDPDRYSPMMKVPPPLSR
jgi:hypothetical protein